MELWEQPYHPLHVRNMVTDKQFESAFYISSSLSVFASLFLPSCRD